MTPRALVHDRLTTLADPTRGRVLLLLEDRELTVSELCAVLQLPQSTVSRHLRVLGDDGWIVSRQEGTSRFYARRPNLEVGADRLWEVVREDLESSRHATEDRTRLERVLAQRQRKSREFFAASAARWDSLRNELFGTSSDLIALLGLLDDDWMVGDLGCGSGRLSELLSPNVQKVVAVDGSEEMLAAARIRLASSRNVDLKSGDLEALPIEDESLDAAVLGLVLHYAAEPYRVLVEAQRVLKPRGKLLIVDMVSHERAEYRQQMGHVWLGFSETQIRGWLAEAGFSAVRIAGLPADPAAKGPRLFSVTAKK